MSKTRAAGGGKLKTRISLTTPDVVVDLVPKWSGRRSLPFLST